jgi:hypothetical protein
MSINTPTISPSIAPTILHTNIIQITSLYKNQTTEIVLAVVCGVFVAFIIIAVFLKFHLFPRYADMETVEFPLSKRKDTTSLDVINPMYVYQPERESSRMDFYWIRMTNRQFSVRNPFGRNREQPIRSFQDEKKIKIVEIQLDDF